MNSSHYLVAALTQWNHKTSFKALALYRENMDQLKVSQPTQVTQQWLIDHYDLSKALFFDEIITQNNKNANTSSLVTLQREHITTLSDVICHESLLDCGQYLNETFGYTHYVQSVQQESADTWRKMLQPEFEDAYYKLCELLHLCFESLPKPFFEQLRSEIAMHLD
eukprot:359999_1